MATTCKIIFGYLDQWGHWYMTNSFYRHYDGYSEAILPHLKKHISSIRNGEDIKVLINNMNNDVKTNSHKFEYDDNFGNTNYMYYIDASNRAKIKCTVLVEDNDFFEKYWINNYKIEQELIL